MKIKEFLTNGGAINLRYVAAKMWPTNKSADAYMSRKLNGDRPWTDKDERKAKQILNDLADLIKEL
ncbi:hypothetical protein ACR79R_20165 [Sphingobacterium spiritivorum]|uniref:hypothetical protein n=1 Tax=Sphingobacterium spiritivorum TaxID=258 RepID=UPI003DA2BE1A